MVSIVIQMQCSHFDWFFPDVDECGEDTDGCAQNCTNNNGSFLCSCGTGYSLGEDNLRCDGR